MVSVLVLKSDTIRKENLNWERQKKKKKIKNSDKKKRKKKPMTMMSTCMVVMVTNSVKIRSLIVELILAMNS